MTVLLNTFSDSSENPFCEVSVKRLTEKIRKMGNLMFEKHESLDIWLERLTGHQKVAGSILVWGSEINF